MTEPPTTGTLAVFRHLKRAALEMRTVTYQELADEPDVTATARGMRHPLNFIHSRLRASRPELPWLVALAVRSDTRRPGDGLLADERGIQGLDIADPHYRSWWRGMVLMVYATDWSDVELR